MPRRDPSFLVDVLDALGGFVYVRDLTEDRNVFISRHWADELGYAADDEGVADGSLLPRIVHPEDRAALAAHQESIRDAVDDRGRSLDYRVRRKDGGVAWLTSVDRPLARDAAGKVTRIVGQAHDITARKAAESGRAEGEARFRAIVENLPDAVFVANHDTEVLLVNDAACAQLGYTREELQNARLADFVAPEFQVRIPERLSVRSGAATARESVHVRKDGTRVPVETVVVGITLDGRPAYMGVARDISDRKRLEAELRDAQRMEAVGRLAGAVAHDFNNILSAILGGASLLEQRLGDADPERAVASEIGTAARRGAELTRQLLTFGRRQPTDMQPLDLSEAVRETLVVLRRLLPDAIAVEADLQPGCVVMADRAMLDQVVMNLTLNARDAMPDGGALRIRVGAGSPRDRVELVVSDTGSGIAPSDLPRVFEPFFTTKEDAQGSGIGLATVYAIVTQHGGSIAVDSAPGAGARFRVSWPRAADAPSTRTPAPRSASSGERRLTILLVDDMEPVRVMVGKLLEARGHRVLRAASPAEALRHWGDHSDGIDLLLTDLRLGGDTDGPGLALRLRGDRPELPVVFMSGFAADREQLRRIPGCDFLQKPFGMEELDALVRRRFPS